MSIKTTTATLIAIALRKRLEMTQRPVHFGLFVRNMPDFDVQKLYNEFVQEIQQSPQPFRLALIGFDGIADKTIATTVEKAITWRNEPAITTPLIVILNPQHTQEQEKLHSLELFEPFEDTDLQRAICQFGQQQSKKQGNYSLSHLWAVLKYKNLGIPLIAAQLAAFYDAIQNDQSPVNALVYLGLLPDPSLAKIIEKQEKETLRKRLQDNYKRVRDLLALEQKDYRALSAALRKGESSSPKTSFQETFLALREYTQRPSTETLAALTYDDVVDLWNIRDTSVNQGAVQTTEKQRQKKDKLRDNVNAQDDILIETLLDGQSLDQKEAEFQELIEREFERLRERPRPITTSSENETDNDHPYTTTLEDGMLELRERRPDQQEEEKRHLLENWMRIWVETDKWGGVIQTSESSKSPEQTVSVRTLLEKAINMTFAPFQPMKPHPETEERMSLITLFEALDDVIALAEGESRLADLLTKLGEQRSLLAEYKISLLYYPLHAVTLKDKRVWLTDYIDTYAQLCQRIQSVCSQAAKQFPDTVEQALAQFLALDTFIIDQPGHEAVLLTSLHPLHVWKWHELAQRIQANTETLGDTDKEILLKRIKQLPTLLNTFLLHRHMLPTPRHIDIPFLVVADTIQVDSKHRSEAATMNIPVYQPVARQTLTQSSLYQVKELIQHFLAFYPPARIGLVVTVIDPPGITPLLKAFQELHKDQILDGCSLHIYYTNDQEKAYDVWNLRNEEAWELFQDNTHWTFNVDIEHTTYASIAEHIQKRGKQHIIILCNPSDAVALSTARTAYALPTPFIVPMHVTYDKIRDSVRITAATDGGMFDSYTGIRNTLIGEQNWRSIGVGNKPAISRRELEALTEQSYWLIVIDRLLSTLEMPPVGMRIAWQSVGQHAVSVWTREKKQWEDYFKDVDVALLEQYLDEVLTIFPDGLLATLTRPDPEKTKTTNHRPKDEVISRLKAVYTTLQWYHQRKNDSAAVLLNIDPRHTQQFTDWFSEFEPSKGNNQTTYMLAVYEQNEALQFDVLAVQAYDETTNELPALSSSRDIINSLEAFAQTLETLFAPDGQKALLVPVRQELLRMSLSAAVFTPPVTSYQQLKRSESEQEQKKQNKARWEHIINDLFTDSSPAIKIQLRHIRVSMQQNGKEPVIHALGTDHYNATIVNLPVLFYERVEPDETEEQTREIRQRSAVEGDLSDTDTPPLPTISLSAPEPLGKKTQTAIPESMHPKTVTLSEDISRQAEQLRRVLMGYGIAVSQVDEERSQVGPRIIRYWVKLQPPAGRLSEVQKYAEDIARELKSKNVPLIENIPGERYIGIDLARTQPETISITPGLQQLPTNQENTLMIAMGVDIAGNTIQQDLVRLPHMLVAGTTGSGKTMFLTTLIMSLVWRHTAQNLELLLIDPKETDFILFQHLPHLRESRIFYEAMDAIHALQTLTSDEREHRKTLLQTAHCPNILEYNRRNPQQRLSWIVIVVDEFADIMNTLSRNERAAFEKQISRLAATGRSIGIHLVLATQRPTTDIVTGTLKANIPTRVSFRLPSGVDSRTILDRSGAERLLGQGDMLALFESEMLRLQGYYAPFDEVKQLLNSLPAR